MQSPQTVGIAKARILWPDPPSGWSRKSVIASSVPLTFLASSGVSGHDRSLSSASVPALTRISPGFSQGTEPARNVRARRSRTVPPGPPEHHPLPRGERGDGGNRGDIRRPGGAQPSEFRLETSVRSRPSGNGARRPPHRGDFPEPEESSDGDRSARCREFAGCRSFPFHQPAPRRTPVGFPRKAAGASAWDCPGRNRRPRR